MRRNTAMKFEPLKVPNAFADAFAKAGYDTGRDALYVLAQRIIGENEHASIDLLGGKLIAELRKIPNSEPIFVLATSEVLRPHAIRFLRGALADMHAGSEAHPPAESQHARGPATNDAGNASAAPAPGAAQRFRESQTIAGRPANLSALRKVANAAALTVMDTHRIRDGRAIGDVRFGELETIRVSNAAEAALIRMIQKHAVPGSHDTKVRDLLSVETFQRYLQLSVELADVS